MKRVYLLSFTDWYFDVFCFLMEPCRCDVYSSSDLNAVSFFIFLVCSEFGRKEDRVEIWIAKSVGWF